MRLWRRRGPLLAALFAMVAAPQLAATWRTPEPVPVERLIENLQRIIDERPDAPHPRYQLGRVCGLAFALGTKQVGTFGFDPPEVAANVWQKARFHGVVPGGPAQSWESRQRLMLLGRAVREHVVALQEDSEPAVYHLGLAYVLASGAHLAAWFDSAELLGLKPLADYEPEHLQYLEKELERLASADPQVRGEVLRLLVSGREPNVAFLDAHRADSDPRVQRGVAELLQRLWRKRAFDEYLIAFRSALVGDAAREHLDYPGDRHLGLNSLVAYEAGQALLQLAEAPIGAWGADPAVLEEVRDGLAVLERLPDPNYITPIVLHLEHAQPLSELLATGSEVRFDLDGDGLAERRPWVRPDTGILVWDPEPSGAITSGRQLFGDATWWMFFRDGYAALDALDDDRNGWLALAELAGLAIWRDADGDAVSDPGEVVAVECLGIAALATRPDTIDGLAPGAREGLLLSDGRRLPTWDWVAEPLPGTGSQAASP